MMESAILSILLLVVLFAIGIVAVDWITRPLELEPDPRPVCCDRCRLRFRDQRGLLQHHRAQHRDELEQLDRGDMGRR